MDRDTSGCLAVARSYRAATLLTAAFRDRTAVKTYVTCVQLPEKKGNTLPFSRSGTINMPLCPSTAHGKRERMVPGAMGAGGEVVEAVTHYEVVAWNSVRACPVVVVFSFLTYNNHGCTTHTCADLRV